jgi:acetyl-CoA C-acetyltransferase
MSRAFEAAGVGVDDIARFDFYSCFPSAVQAGAAAVGIDPGDPRGLTVTGGLPYFGGPGNNYPMHAIATMHELLLGAGGLALVTGLGGFTTKHAAGIYGSAPPPDGFRRGDTIADQRAIDASAITLAVVDADGLATVDGSTVVYAADGTVEAVPVIATLDDGRRVAAQAHPAELASIGRDSLVGARVRVSGSPASYRIESEPAAPGR